MNSMLTYNGTLLSPATGYIKDLQEIDDEVYSSGMMGSGLAIILDGSDYNIYSPTEGEVTVLFPTGHAIGIKSAEGVDLLIHIGIDSFREKDLVKKYIKQGDRVHKGQPLVKINESKFGTDDNIVILTLPGYSKEIEKTASVEKVKACVSEIIKY
ncbi:MAG TPA: PTS glucose transporter subunit IIA [Clostridia bacterium]|nr:PTS glucose transporter subunit IIA [Clostridia bacterium]